MGPNDHEENSAGEGLSGEGGGDIVPSTAMRRTSIPVFLSQQVHDVNGLMVQMTAMKNVKLEARTRFLEAYQSEIMAPMMGRSEEDENSGRSQWNVDLGHFRWIDVRSIGKKPYEDAAYSHRASGRSGTLICYENNNSRDDHAEGKRLWPSKDRLAVLPDGSSRRQNTANKAASNSTSFCC